MVAKFNKRTGRMDLFLDPDDKTPLITLHGDLYCTAAMGDPVGCLDSISADLGEIGYQLYDNEMVERESYTPGYLYAFSEIPQNEETAYKKVTAAQWKEIAIAVIDHINEMYRSRIRRGFFGIQFAFLGNDKDFEIDRYLFDRFRKADYGVFRCVEGMTCDEDCYIAVFNELAARSKCWLDRQKGIKLWPDVKEETDDYEYDEEEEYWEV